MPGIPVTNHNVIRAYISANPDIIKAQLTSDTKPTSVSKWYPNNPYPSHFKSNEDPEDPRTVVTHIIYLSNKIDLSSAKTADNEPLYTPKSLWSDEYYEYVKKSGIVNSSGASQGGTDSLPVLIKSSLINLDTTTLCVDPMCMNLCERLTKHAPHNFSIEQSRNGHQQHPAHVAAIAANSQKYYRCPVLGDSFALPLK